MPIRFQANHSYPNDAHYNDISEPVNPSEIYNYLFLCIIYNFTQKKTSKTKSRTHAGLKTFQVLSRIFESRLPVAYLRHRPYHRPVTQVLQRLPAGVAAIAGMPRNDL